MTDHNARRLALESVLWLWSLALASGASYGTGIDLNMWPTTFRAPTRA